MYGGMKRKGEAYSGRWNGRAGVAAISSWTGVGAGVGSAATMGVSGVEGSAEASTAGEMPSRISVAAGVGAGGGGAAFAVALNLKAYS